MKGGKIRATSIDGYTKPQYTEVDEEMPIATGLKSAVNGYVRDRVIGAGNNDVVVRSRVTYNRKNSQLNIEIKILGIGME